MELNILCEKHSSKSRYLRQPVIILSNLSELIVERQYFNNLFDASIYTFVRRFNWSDDS